MGKLTKSVVGSMVCGSKYQKFDDDDEEQHLFQSKQVELESSGFSRKRAKKYLSYNCEECGHKGLLVKKVGKSKFCLSCVECPLAILI